MKGKRAKQYRKLMQQYSLSFGFREPYQVLVDAQMIQDTERFKMDLVTSLERTLSAKVKPMITQCSIRHLYNLSEMPQALKDALIITAKSMERRRCNHHTLDEPLSTLECLSSVIDPKGFRSNKHCYVVASQEEQTRRHCRSVRGVPLIYVKRSVMVMEPMTQASVGSREGIEREKFRSGLKTRSVRPGKRKRDDDEDEVGRGGGEQIEDVTRGEAKENGQMAKKVKVRGQKGPNPLSVKKATKSHKSRDNESRGQRAAPSGVSSGVQGDDIQEGYLGDENLEGHQASNKKRKRRRHKSSRDEVGAVQ